MGKLNYKQIACQKIKDKRNLVVSAAYDSGNNFIGYAVSEQLIAQEEGNTETKVFLKNGLGILSFEGLMQCRDVLTEAIEELKKAKKSN